MRKEEPPRSFYERQVWKELRYRALKIYGRQCMNCRRLPNEDLAMHVDHVKPISIYPEMALTLQNLQVLCADCNLGKSNKHFDDFRPKLVRPEPRIEEETTSPAVAVQDHQKWAELAAKIKNKIKVAEMLEMPDLHAAAMREYLDVQRKLKEL